MGGLSFAQNEDGKWGYRVGADAVIPFSNTISKPDKYAVDYYHGHGTNDTLTPTLSGLTIGNKYFFIARCSNVNSTDLEWIKNIKYGNTYDPMLYYGVFTAKSESIKCFISKPYKFMGVNIWKI